MEFVALGFLVFAYFLPLLVAVSRGHHDAVAIGAMNTLLGWTMLGWALSLVWSLTAVRAQTTH